MSTTIVLFGFTGDLAQKKLIKALHENFVAKTLESPVFVGVHRRDWSDEQAREYIRELIGATAEKAYLDAWRFVRGPLEKPDTFSELSKTILLNQKALKRVLFHIALPVSSYDEIIEGLRRELSSGLATVAESCCLLFEKPFGDDLITSKRLFLKLERFLDEKQLFLVDHYLFKPGAQTLAQYIPDTRTPVRVHLKLLENSVVGNRCTFYNPAGALKDVGQNHLLELGAQFGAQFIKTPRDIKKRREAFLESLIPLTQKTIKTAYTRSQYAGYECTNFDGTGSDTETYFKLHLHSALKRFAGTEFVLESGKGFAEAVSECVITFGDGEIVTIPLATPKPAVSEYAQMYHAASKGDFSSAVSKAEILASWKVIDSVKKWEREVPLGTYEQAVQKKG
jgi:glucose-6-phosphate 1-dehydrogenase